MASNINQLVGQKQHKTIMKYKTGHEKQCCRRFDILKLYPFPQFPETKFVPEDIVWEKINQNYNQYCINDVLRIYYQDTGDNLSSMNINNKSKSSSMFYLFLFYLNDCFYQIGYNKLVQRSVLNVGKWGIYAGKNYLEIIRPINKMYKRVIVTIFLPLMYVYCRRKIKKNGKSN